MSKRAYLPADQRRAQLLYAAATLVQREGWHALTMKGVAEEAGVSRRAVYTYFADGAALFEALLRSRFAHYEEERARIFANTDKSQRLEKAIRLFFRMPPEDRQVFRALVTSVGPSTPEVEATRETIRKKVLGFWVPRVLEITGVERHLAEAASWALANAMWSVADKLDDGTLDEDEATQLVVRLLSGAIMGLTR